MLARITLVWNRLTNSLWALPIAVCLANAVLAIVAVRANIKPGTDPVWWLYSGSAADASTFISNLLSAMITMATLAISITMVVLTLAAQSLGPRLIPIFMGDNRTKLALGILLGTVVYLLLILRSVAGDATAVPNLAVTLAVVLSLASVLLLLFFVHHLATSIVADTVIDRVGAALDNQVRALSSERTGNDRGLSKREENSFRKAANAVKSSRAGYIQAINYAALCSAAAKRDIVVLLGARPGHLILEGQAFAWVKSKEAANDDELVQTVEQNIILGTDRTPSQDLEYSIRQLVEIALRALSPGINDPHTASAVIDRLTMSVALLMKRRSETDVWCDETGKVRIYQPGTNFSSLLSVAFTEIRQAGANTPAALLTLIQRYDQLLAIAPADNRNALRTELKLLKTTIRHAIKNPADRKKLLDSFTA